MIEIYALTGVSLFVLGLVGVILRDNLVQKLVSFNIFTSGIFLVFITLTTTQTQNDSISTALVLTGLVVTLGATSFGLMLIRAYYKDKQ
ncbi:NADH-quinone oxidoreductase subunit K [Arcobacter sp. FWKO B]|uniref:NADH-quinone oxidoreductase subunit K n=1 Tax=Arcobacter sp. FWKO B TaxID=2593672 RepID=UPI0018A410B7|nr:NADH-quinone oxidoreductase subunit K [Arcobacter sp. FWKO B]QOG13156.1 Na+/H+ antiporter subunit C [Arcobacter sp. FWKO B]